MVELPVTTSGYPGWYRERVACLREGVARQDSHRRAHRAGLPRHVCPEHGPSYDIEGNPHHLTMDVEDILRGVDLLQTGEHRPPSGQYLVDHRCCAPTMENGL